MRPMLSRSVMPCALLLLCLSASAQEAKVDAEAAIAADTNASAAVDAEVTAAAATEVAPTTATAATEAAPAPASTSGLVGTPPEGKGQIVFFRPSKFVGGA